VLQAALDAVKGKIEDKPAFMKALRGIKVNTVRGPVSFDAYGNVVGNVYIRKVERKEGRLVNIVVHTYPTSASSGPTSRRTSSRTRCTRATGRRRRIWNPDICNSGSSRL
jgi:hypothetical protein